MVIFWIVFVGSVLLMSPKGGLGIGIGWVAGGNEYGSKKSIESRLKNIALVSGVAFVVVIVILPFLK